MPPRKHTLDPELIAALRDIQGMTYSEIGVYIAQKQGRRIRYTTDAIKNVYNKRKKELRLALQERIDT